MCLKFVDKKFADKNLIERWYLQLRETDSSFVLSRRDKSETKVTDVSFCIIDTS